MLRLGMFKDNRRVFIVLAVIALIVMLPVAWYLGSPLFINQVVSETFPSTSQSGSMSGATALASGQFGVIDGVHQGSGKAVIYRLADGKLVLRFEDFKVTNGPDLYVYFSGHPAPRTSADLHQTGDFEVSTLKGNIGTQNYELPAGFEFAKYKSVVIYCKRFTTVFSTAELSSAR